MKKKAMRARRRHATMAAVAACAMMVATGASADASHVPQFIAGTKAMIAAAEQQDLALPKVERIQVVRRRLLAPQIMAALDSVDRLNKSRALDWRLRELLLAGLIGPQDIHALQMCVSADALARTIRTWKPKARNRLCEIDNVVLLVNGHPTRELEELWENGFRPRNRREGALERIEQGFIVPAPRRELIAA